MTLPSPADALRYPQSLSRSLSALWQSRAGRGSLWGLAILVVAAAVTPLVQVPGYELGELLTVFAAGAAGPLALELVRAGGTPLRAALAAATWLIGLCLLATFAIALRAALGSHCSPFAGLPFIFLLPLPTALIGAVFAAGLGALLGRRQTGVALAIYGLSLIACLIHGAWPVYFGPQAFGYDHLLGYVPGPLYDENLSPPLALWHFRLLTLAATFGLGLSLAVTPRLVPPLAVLFVWATGPLEHRLGTRSSIADLDRALGATRALGTLTIHAPRELPAARLDALLRAAAVARAEVAQALGVPAESPGQPLDVFFHRSPEEKGVLTGAGQTHFTKPWLGQIQTEVDAPGILRHEMVHALAAQIGGGAFGVGRHLFFNIGVVEGLAEAIDWPADRFTLDEWCAGMRAAKLGLSPAQLLGNSGQFYAAAQGPAYTVAGAFLHWLLSEKGSAAVKRLYRSGDFTASLGADLPELSRQFEAHLDRLPTSLSLRHAAAERFRARALFARPCGREVAGLRDQAAQLDGSGDHLTAASLYARCAALDPAEPRYLESRWRALQEAHDPAAAEALADLLAAPSVDDAVRARVAVLRGDQAGLDGRLPDARAAFDEARALGLDPATDRSVQIRLSALELPDIFAALHRYFEGPRDDLSLLGLSEAAAAHPGFAPIPYLLGLAASGRNEPAWGLRELRAAIALGLPDDLRAQALRVAVDCALRSSDSREAREDLALLAAMVRPAAEQRQTEDLAARLQWEATLFPESPPDR